MVLFAFFLFMLTAVGIVYHRSLAAWMVGVWRFLVPVSEGEARVVRYFLLVVLCLMAIATVAMIVLSF